MTRELPSSIKVLYLLSFTPRGQHLPLRIVNNRKRVILEDAEYTPFPFLAIPKENEGEVVNIEVEFPRNRRRLQGVPFYELDQAEVTVRVVREDRPTHVMLSYSGIFALCDRRMLITHLQMTSSPLLAGTVMILRWNDQAPTGSGWYWLLERETSTCNEGAKIVEVVDGKFGLEVHFSGTEGAKALRTIVGQWSGPIPLPENI